MDGSTRPRMHAHIKHTQGQTYDDKNIVKSWLLTQFYIDSGQHFSDRPNVNDPRSIPPLGASSKPNFPKSAIASIFLLSPQVNVCTILEMIRMLSSRKFSCCHSFIWFLACCWCLLVAFYISIRNFFCELEILSTIIVCASHGVFSLIYSDMSVAKCPKWMISGWCEEEIMFRDR